MKKRTQNYYLYMYMSMRRCDARRILSTSCVIFSYPKLLSISVLMFIKWRLTPSYPAKDTIFLTEKTQNYHYRNYCPDDKNSNVFIRPSYFTRLEHAHCLKTINNMSEEKVSTRGRKRTLTDSERKRNRCAVSSKWNKGRIYVGDQLDRWNELKEVLRVQTHAIEAKILLDR